MINPLSLKISEGANPLSAPEYHFYERTVIINMEESFSHSLSYMIWCHDIGLMAYQTMILWKCYSSLNMPPTSKPQSITSAVQQTCRFRFLLCQMWRRNKRPSPQKKKKEEEEEGS